MKDRRFKIGVISMDVAAKWGKDLGKQIQASIPDGSIVLKNQEDFKSGSLFVLIHHKDFEIVPLGEELPKVILEIKEEVAEKSKIIYPH